MTEKITKSAKSDPRVLPRQARAQARIERILEAAEILLATGQDVTTSAIAESAEIPVGSIYRYFPNVLGVYRSLFERINFELRDRIRTVMEIAGPDSNWHDLFENILFQAVNLYDQHPAYGNLLLMMSNPVLQNVRQECIDKTSELFAIRWRAGLDGFHGGDAETVARAAAKLFTFIEQSYFEQTDADAAFPETVKALKAYLAIYLKP